MARQQATDTLAVYRELVNHLQTGPLRSVYWLTGPETWFADRLIPRFKGLVPDGLDDFNLDVFSGRETKLARVLDACKTFPMMADRRVVIVRDFMAMFDRRKSVESDDADSDVPTGSQEELLHYVEHSNPSTVLVLADASSVPGNTKLGKTLRNPQLAYSAEFNRLQGNDLARWIQQIVKENHGRSIDEQAAFLLAEISGNDLLSLSHEIGKLASFDREASGIKAEHVRMMATEHKEAAVFDVKDALYANNLDKLLQTANIVVGAADTPVGGILGLLGYLTSHYVQCWQISRMHEKGMAKNDIQAASGKNSYIFERMYRDARALPASDYPAVFEILLDADSATKGMGHSDPTGVLNFTMIKLHQVHTQRR